MNGLMAWMRHKQKNQIWMDISMVYLSLVNDALLFTNGYVAHSTCLPMVMLSTQHMFTNGCVEHSTYVYQWLCCALNICLPMVMLSTQHMFTNGYVEHSTCLPMVMLRTQHMFTNGYVEHSTYVYQWLCCALNICLPMVMLSTQHMFTNGYVDIDMVMINTTDSMMMIDLKRALCTTMKCTPSE